LTRASDAWSEAVDTRTRTNSATTFVDVPFGGQGGGIFNFAALTAIDSTFVGNQANSDGSGAGIFNGFVANLKGNTFASSPDSGQNCTGFQFAGLRPARGATPSRGESAKPSVRLNRQTLTEFEEFQIGLIVFLLQFEPEEVSNSPRTLRRSTRATQAVTMTLSSASFGPSQ
jgi:hypothetical protein